MKIAVVTDRRRLYLTKEEYAEYGIYVLPMSVIFGPRNLVSEKRLILLLKNSMQK